MSIRVQRESGVVIASPDGRIDSSNSREFHTELEGAVSDSDTALILDFEAISYISSAGLRVILLTGKSLQKSDTKFALCSMSDSIREIFKISGFEKIIDIHGSRAEALSAMGA